MKLEYLLVAVIGLLGLVSCEKSESLMTILPEDGVIRVSAGVDDPLTRAGVSINNFAKFGMFVEPFNISNLYSYSNVEINKINSVWTTSEMMLWKNETDKVEIIAYAPYNADFSNLTTVRTISVLADQSTDKNVIASDFLYAKSSVHPSAPNVNNLIHYNADEKKVEAKLNHHFSKLLLTIIIKGEFHGVSDVANTNPISNLVIKGTNTSATLALEDGDIASTTNPLSITPCTEVGTYEGLNEENDTGSAIYEAIIIPQTVTTLSIEFTIDGKDYVWTAPSPVDFASGKSRTLALTVGKSSVEPLPTLTISPALPSALTSRVATTTSDYIITVSDPQNYTWKATSNFDISDVSLSNSTDNTATASSITGDSGESLRIHVEAWEDGNTDVFGNITIELVRISDGSTITEEKISQDMTVYVYVIIGVGTPSTHRIFVYDRNAGIHVPTPEEVPIAPNYTNNAPDVNPLFKGDYYTWDKAMDDENSDGSPMCVAGWRLPTKDEMSAINAKIKRENHFQDNSFSYIENDVAGKKCYFPLSGFNKLPNELVGRYWSSTERDDGIAGWWYLMLPTMANIVIATDGQPYEDTVRCVKTVP